MSLLQGLEASDPKRIEEVFSLIARKLGSQVPAIEAKNFTDKVSSFEVKYVEEKDLISSLRKVKHASIELFNLLLNMSPGITQVIEGVPERLLIDIQSFLDALQMKGHLAYSWGVNGIGFAVPGQAGGGAFGTLSLTLKSRTIDVAKSL